MSPSRAPAFAPFLPALLALVCLTTGCASAGVPMGEVAAEINATLDPHPARFLPGDTVDVKFEQQWTMYDQKPVVDFEGRVSFVGIGSITVLGQSPDQVEELLKRSYLPVLGKQPDLSVNLLWQNADTFVGSTNRAIHVLGEVRNPGPIPCLGKDWTLVEALARAGSFDKRSALLKQVLLVRWMPEPDTGGTYRSWKIDARPGQWESPEQVRLQAYDVVFVPQKPIDKVDIWIDQYIRQLIPFPYLIPPVY